MEILTGVRIAVDGRLGSDHGTGVTTYAANLIGTLQQLGAQVERVIDGEIPVAGGRAALQRWANASALGSRQLIPLIRTETGQSWSRSDLFREAQVHFNIYGRILPIRCSHPPDIMHWTYPVPLVMEGTRNVYTVHDAIPWDHPHLTGISRDRHRRMLDRISRAADQILTVSDHSREALIPRLTRFDGAILNTYQAVCASAPTDMSLPSGLARQGYLLFCGSVEPRKNVGRLIAAYVKSGVTLPLVIAGPDGWRADGEWAPDLSRKGVLRLPWMERSKLVALLSQARALLFPSLAEGFGLPVMEAMALGTPVVTSNQGAVAEIAGTAAVTVNPYDITALAHAIAAVAGDAALRETLRSAGLARARTFDTASHARRLASAYAALPKRPDLPRLDLTHQKIRPPHLTGD